MARRRRKGLSVRKLKEILRLSLECGLDRREIARSLSVSHTTVNGYVGRAEELGLSYAGVEGMSEEELECLLRREEAGSGSSFLDSARGRPQPDWDGVHRELKKKGVTLQLLWQEYKEVHPEGYQLSQFYERYRQWKGKLSLSMWQDYRAGEKLFVDYAGQTVPGNFQQKLPGSGLYIGIEKG
jgi:transposase